MKWIVKKIVECLNSNGIIEKNMIEIYEYGEVYTYANFE